MSDRRRRRMSSEGSDSSGSGDEGSDHEYESAVESSDDQARSDRKSPLPGEGEEEEDVRGAGDGQEESKVDDDQDRSNPQYIPKRGNFYEHDDREEDDDEGKNGSSSAKEPSQPARLRRSEQKPRWGHDKFLEMEQAPKTKEELVTTYGYDIRNEDNAPRARRRRRYGRGPNKYTRQWEDENAYSNPGGGGGDFRGGRREPQGFAQGHPAGPPPPPQQRRDDVGMRGKPGSAAKTRPPAPFPERKKVDQAVEAKLDALSLQMSAVQVEDAVQAAKTKRYSSMRAGGGGGSGSYFPSASGPPPSAPFIAAIPDAVAAAAQLAAVAASVGAPVAPPPPPAAPAYLATGGLVNFVPVMAPASAAAPQPPEIAAVLVPSEVLLAGGQQGYAEVRGGVTYFNPTAQPNVVKNVSKRPKAAIPIVDPAQVVQQHRSVSSA